MSLHPSHIAAARVAEKANVSAKTIRAYNSRKEMPAGIRCPCRSNGLVWEEAVIDEWIERRRRRSERGFEKLSTDERSAICTDHQFSTLTIDQILERYNISHGTFYRVIRVAGMPNRSFRTGQNLRRNPPPSYECEECGVKPKGNRQRDPDDGRMLCHPCYVAAAPLPGDLAQNSTK